jgi:hypothetical protein
MDIPAHGSAIVLFDGKDLNQFDSLLRTVEYGVVISPELNSVTSPKPQTVLLLLTEQEPNPAPPILDTCSCA